MRSHRGCLGDSYVAMKEVSILGESEEHQSNVVNAAEMNRYKIMKLNKYAAGCRSHSLFVVHLKGAALLLCSCVCLCVCVCVCLCACPRYGIKQKRVVAVDGVAKELYNFDRHLRVRKKLPLEQLVQVLGVWCYR